MSPRRNRPHKPARGHGAAESEPESESEAGLGRWPGGAQQWRGEDWIVRPVAGGSATKHYRCPGCDQQIPPGTPHVVAWREHDGVDDRRHWHRACWNARDRRTTRVQRSRNAPRY